MPENGGANQILAEDKAVLLENLRLMRAYMDGESHNNGELLPPVPPSYSGPVTYEEIPGTNLNPALTDSLESADQFAQDPLPTPLNHGTIQEADRQQWESYKEILGENAPRTFADFQNLKYHDAEKWEYTKRLAKYLQKYPTSDKKYFDIWETLKSQGIKKGVVLPPVQKQAFILPSGKYDPYHIMHRMRERNITDDEIRSYMQNAKIMFVQWDGQRQLFVSRDGISVITKDGDNWIYKTAWKKNDNDEDTVKIMEAIKNAGL